MTLQGRISESPASVAGTTLQLAGMRNTIPPENIRQHPQIAQHWFYTIPSPVWDLLQTELRPFPIDRNTLAFELEVSRVVDAAPGAVGLRNGMPFSDPYLINCPPPSVSNPMVADYFQQARQAGMVTADVDRVVANDITPMRDAERAYLGWLLTNRTFLDQLRLVRESHCDLFAGGQCAPQPIVVQSNPFVLNDAIHERADATASAVRDFSIHWRLRALTGPITFAPLSVQTPAGLPSMVANLSQSSGTLVFIPDIAPLPDRDQLRILLENATRQTIRHADHLSEWYRMVRAGNLGRKSLQNFSAMYRLQHYLRVLNARYAEHFKRQQQAVAKCLGRHLELSETQVKRLTSSIKTRLGPEWLAPDRLARFVN